MNDVQFYTSEDLKQITRWRWGEEKIGEVLKTAQSWEALAELDARYVLLGIPEDIGVRANFGRPGAAKAWKSVITVLSNFQNNENFDVDNLVLLGEVDCKEEMLEAMELTDEDPFFPNKIGALVKGLDEKVSRIVKAIIDLNKIPILIGGGHNNAYGNIKGSSESYGNPVNAINLDAHTDFRPLEHRHSGNGFSYAKEDGFLNKYFIVGLHKNYTSQAILDSIEEVKTDVKYVWLEDIYASGKSNLKTAIEDARKHCGSAPFGLEIDLDVLAGMGSSAMSPLGFSLNDARFFVSELSGHKNCCYIHICEGAPKYELFENQVARSTAYLISKILQK